MAAVLGGSVLLVAGGYSGRPRGDLMAYKVPPFVFQAPALDVSTGLTGRERVAVGGGSMGLLQIGGEVERKTLGEKWGDGVSLQYGGSAGLREECSGVFKVLSSWS